MLEEGLKQLIEFVKAASSVLWQAAYKQVYADAVVNSIWLLIMLMITFFAIKLVVYSIKEFKKDIERRKKETEATGKVYNWNTDEKDDNSSIGTILLFSFVAILPSVISIMLLTDVVRWLINPEWYAIQKLINMIPK
jgi:hypothetical protein